MTRNVPCVILCFLGGAATMYVAKAGDGDKKEDAPLRLGNFSVSLTVKDIAVSRAFYEKLGFKVFAGDQAKNWFILQNASATIGLFQGAFDKNTLTFTPGGDRTATTRRPFHDVRRILGALRSRGLVVATGADEASSDLVSLMLIDPDQNPILIDQHVPAPGSFVAGVRGANATVLYEGLPHQMFEQEALQQELASKATVRFHEFPFYQEPLLLSESDERALREIVSACDSFVVFSGEKKCGGFHPDYCVEWRDSDGNACRMLVCLGCHEAKLCGEEGEARYDLRGTAYAQIKGILTPYRKNRPEVRPLEDVPDRTPSGSKRE